MQVMVLSTIQPHKHNIVDFFIYLFIYLFTFWCSLLRQHMQMLKKKKKKKAQEITAMTSCY